MSSQIFEEEGNEPASGGMATSQQKIEKQARQLAYDTRYEVKKEIGDKQIAPTVMKQLLLRRLQRSSAAPNIKLRAKQMLLGEDYIGNVEDFASDTLANALFKVFVENNNTINPEEIELSYLKELNQDPNRKYKVRVTDKKTGNSYVRFATRDKISQLRLNPNISSVEMTEYGEPREGERKGGEQTAKAKAGKGLNNDGNLANNYPPYDKVTRGDVIAGATGKDQMGGKRKVKEEFLIDAANEDQNPTKITGKGVNNYAGKNPAVKIMPEDHTSERTNTGTTPRSVYAHYEAEGEIIAETGYSKFLNMLQEKKMTKAEKAKEKKLKAKYDKSGMKASMKKQYGERGEDVYFATIRKQAMKEEMGCDSEGKKSKSEGDDERALPTKINLFKNKLRAMGAKNPIVMAASYEPEGDVIDERRREDEGKPRPERDRAVEFVRSKNKGIMTRSGRTIAQHEADRGVPERDRSKEAEETTADRLAAKKRRAAAAKSSAERAEREEERRRRLA